MNGCNAIVVDRDGETSRLTQCLGYPPVKFINPRPQGGSCQVYISNYGGGLVDGDFLRMSVACGESARLYLGTQSSTKVYRANGKGGCVQETVGTVHAKALVVVCPDPVVPYAGSRYRQTQSWEVHPEADLVLFDWLQPGRASRGEVFAYEELRSELRVSRPGGAAVLAERFSLAPARQDPYRCGHFGSFRSFLNISMIGPRLLPLGEKLETGILALNDAGGGGREIGPGNPERWIGMGKRDGEGYVIRAMGRSRRDLQPLHDLIFAALADAAWLGFNPWIRRW